MQWQRRQLGDMYRIPLQGTFGGSLDVANWPTMKVFNSAGTLVETSKLLGWPARLDGAASSNFGVFFTFLGANYSVGKHSVILTHTYLGGTVRKEAHQLEIVAGGDIQGAVIGSYYNGLPEANSVVYQLDNGDLVRKANPR